MVGPCREAQFFAALNQWQGAPAASPSSRCPQHAQTQPASSLPPCPAREAKISARPRCRVSLPLVPGIHKRMRSRRVRRRVDARGQGRLVRNNPTTISKICPLLSQVCKKAKNADCRNRVSQWRQQELVVCSFRRWLSRCRWTTWPPLALRRLNAGRLHKQPHTKLLHCLPPNFQPARLVGKRAQSLLAEAALHRRLLRQWLLLLLLQLLLWRTKTRRRRRLRN